MSLNKELLDILVCPASKGKLELTPEEDGLICRESGLVYPIVDGIPVMLTSEAVPLAEWPEKKPAASEDSETAAD